MVSDSSKKEIRLRSGPPAMAFPQVRWAKGAINGESQPQTIGTAILT